MRSVRHRIVEHRVQLQRLRRGCARPRAVLRLARVLLAFVDGGVATERARSRGQRARNEANGPRAALVAHINRVAVRHLAREQVHKGGAIER